MDKYEIRKAILIFLFAVLPILTGYIASRRGRNPVSWALFTFFSCGICSIVIFILPKLPKYERDLLYMERNMKTKGDMQMEIDRAQMQTNEQVNNIAQISDIFR